MTRSLTQRTLFLSFLLGAEALLASILLDGATLIHKDGFLTALIRDHGAWTVKGVMGFAALFATFTYLRYKPALGSISGQLAQTSVRPLFLVGHFAAISLFAVLSWSLYGSGSTPLPANLTAGLWFAGAVAAIVFAALAAAPWPVWIRLLHSTQSLWVFCAAASFAACVAGELSWRLWGPASRLTYSLVELALRPFVTDMVVQPAKMLIGTERFTVIVSPECSGLEGAALMLIFSVIWLVLFRDEIRFPRVLVLIPAGVVLLFLLNAVRIAVLVMIGNAGARDIAAKGFHSQAGWIAFNSVAFGFSVTARRVDWFSNDTRVAESAAVDYPAAPWLVPFLAILAAGMTSRALTGNFEWTYFLRLLAATGALWVFRKRYRDIDWRFSWFGIGTGLAVFALWISYDRLSLPASGDPMPVALAGASAGIRVLWISARILAGVLTVPIAEELAFRGFLLRRLISPRFEVIAFRRFTAFSLAASSLVFGLLHGQKWLVGTAAGAMFACASLRKGRLGDAVAAHATANALLAAYVLEFQKWSLW